MTSEQEKEKKGLKSKQKITLEKRKMHNREP
jgi:hypothetical protein